MITIVNLTMKASWANCRDGIRTRDLQVMSLASYQLLLLCDNKIEVYSCHNDTDQYRIWATTREDRIRTCDPLVPNQVLYQAELLPGSKGLDLVFTSIYN